MNDQAAATSDLRSRAFAEKGRYRRSLTNGGRLRISHNLAGRVAVTAPREFLLPSPLLGLLLLLVLLTGASLRRASATGTTNIQPFSVSAGQYVTVAVKSNGTVWDWGWNGYGQLGNGTTTNSTYPVQVSNLTGAVAVSAGWGHTVALKGDGTVWAWGYNNYGQLGNGLTTNSSVPVQVSNLSNVVSIAAGYYYTVAVKSDGTVWAWGYNNYGQLGIGTTANSTTPVQVSNLSNVVAIAANESQTVALKSDGTVWNWGWNNQGQLGNGTTANSTTPVQVIPLSGMVGVAAGYGLSAALKSDGTVWTWGYNAYGQLGNGTTTGSSTPVQLTSLSGIVALAAGYDECMALKSDGTVWDWGWNNQGQLGNGNTTNNSNPVQVTNLGGAVSISVGYAHGAALKSDGTISTWGYNLYGQLGNTSSVSSSTPVSVSGTSSFLVVAPHRPWINLGGYHALAVQPGGSVDAWGDNSCGQLGNGGTTSYASAQAVPDLSGITAVAAGAYHSLALRSDGTVWAWGYNSAGQLGDGTQTTRLSPVQVEGAGGTGHLTNIVAVAAGSAHSLALRSDGTVWAWGYNGDGELGIANLNVFSAVPIQVAGGLSGVKALFAGDRTALALESNGTVWVWGSNGQGQLGNGTTTPSSIPAQVTGFASGVPIRDLGNNGSSSSSDQPIVVAADGTVWTWGKDDQGQLGDSASGSYRTAPYHVGGSAAGGIVSTVTSGNAFSLALATGDVLLGWGRNADGELSDGSTTQRTAPEDAGSTLPTGTVLAVVVAGNEQVIALTSAGALLTWGASSLSPPAGGPDTNGDGIPDSSEATFGLRPAQISWNGVVLTYDPAASAVSASNPNGNYIYHDNEGLALSASIALSGATTLTDPTGETYAGTYSSATGAFAFTGTSPGATTVLNPGTTLSQDGQSMQVNGNLDVAGNILTLGTWTTAANASANALSISYLDAQGLNPSQLRFAASHSASDWIWSEATADNTEPQMTMMELDPAHQLILHDTTSADAAGVTLDPAGPSKFKNVLVVAPQGDLSMGAYTNGTAP